MEETQKNQFSNLTNLDAIKEYCNSHLFEIATGELKTTKNSVKVRFIVSNQNFGYTGLGHFFFFDDCMYIITTDEKYKIDHNPDILESMDELEILKYTGVFIARVIFAGVFTGYRDDIGTRIFTGDIVNATVLLNPTIPSIGGINRARNKVIDKSGIPYEAGVDEMLGNYSIILDNQSVPLSWASKLKVIGSLFFDLSKGETEVNIHSLCNRYVHPRTDKNELKNLIKKSPYFPPATWQEKAIELLCGDDKIN